MKKPVKTNAMRLLDASGICYRAVTYDYDETDLSAEKAAGVLGVEAGLLYKTLVLRGDRSGIFVCMVPGGGEIDLKKAALASGNKKVAMVSVKELSPLTGYVRGGCSPVGMKKPYPIYIDAGCREQEFIYISAGVRGVQLKIAVADLISFTGAVVVQLR